MAAAAAEELTCSSEDPNLALRRDEPEVTPERRASHVRYGCGVWWMARYTLKRRHARQEVRIAGGVGANAARRVDEIGWNRTGFATRGLGIALSQWISLYMEDEISCLLGDRHLPMGLMGRIKGHGSYMQHSSIRVSMLFK